MLQVATSCSQSSAVGIFARPMTTQPPCAGIHWFKLAHREAKSVREARLADVAARGAATPRPAGPLQMTGPCDSNAHRPVCVAAGLQR
jgi:hypothetical protein